MISFLFTIIMLTALFSVTAGLAFIFRKTVLKSKESGMYYIWLAVLIFALVPIRIGDPSLILFPQKPSQTQTDTITARDNIIKLSELTKYTSLPDLEDDINATQEIQASIESSEAKTEYAKPKTNINIIKFVSGNKDGIVLGLLVIWAVGFICVLAKTIQSYFRMKRILYRESYVCVDERINAVFRECLEIAGLKRRINFRIMKWNFSSPCVCGLINPTVFIETSCTALNEQKLKYIFVHELYHIKGYDVLYKTLSVIVTGAHWFNPLAYKVAKAITEDCELSVDRHVMSVFRKKSGISLNEQSDYYMNIILDIAEKKCAGKPPVSIPYASLFFGEERNIKFLKRRYNNMKSITNKKHLIVASSMFLAVIILINTLIMSSCGIIGTTTVSAAQSPVEVRECLNANVYEAAIRNYFGLLPGEEITQKQLAEITDIKIVKGINVNGDMAESIGGTALGGMTPVSLVINDREFSMIPSVIHKRIFVEHINAKIIEAFAEDKEIAGEMAKAFAEAMNNYDLTSLEGYGYSRDFRRLNAYFTIKDVNAPGLEPDAIAEMLLEYPITSEYPIAVFDPLATVREYREMLERFAAAGLLDDNFVTDDTIDAAYLDNLPNLRTAAFVGITADNTDLLADTVIVTTEPYTGEYYTEEKERSTTTQPISGVFEAPNYGINTDPNGTEYLEFKNQSLRAAIAEYFNVVDGEYKDFIPWNNITTDMLAQITSISVTRKPEYDYIYDYPEAQIPLKGMYLEYTINGKILGILPETFRADIEQIFESGELDVLKYCDKVLDGMYGEDSYHYVLKESLNTDDKLFLSSVFAKFGMIRIAIYQADNGEYFTVGRPDYWGFTARYYDQAEYDVSDISYMPNVDAVFFEGISQK